MARELTGVIHVEVLEMIHSAILSPSPPLPPKSVTIIENHMGLGGSALISSLDVNERSTYEDCTILISTGLL